MITKSWRQCLQRLVPHDLQQRRVAIVTPYPTDQTVDDITPVYEGHSADPSCATGSGSLAPAVTKLEENRTLAITGGSYVFSQDEPRYEGKLTYALNAENNVKVSYTNRTTATKNNRQGTVMDLASLLTATRISTYTVNYTSVVTSRLFFEGQFSQKVSTTTNVGSRFTDLVKGHLHLGSPAPRRHGQSAVQLPDLLRGLAAAGGSSTGTTGTGSSRRRFPVDGGARIAQPRGRLRRLQGGGRTTTGSRGSTTSPRRPRLSRVRRSTRSCGTTTRRSSTGCRSWSAASATTSGPIPVRQRYLALQQRSDVQLRRANRSEPLEGSERVRRSCATRNGARPGRGVGLGRQTAAGSRAPASLRRRGQHGARRRRFGRRAAGQLQLVLPGAEHQHRRPSMPSPRSRHCRFSGTGSFRTVVTPVRPAPRQTFPA